MKQNVLEIIGSFHIGGTERQAVQLSRLLHEEGSFGVFVACLDARGELRNELGESGLGIIPEFRLTSFYDVNFWRQIRRCVKFLRSNKISIVHTHDFYTNVFGMTAATLAKIPVRIASKRNTYSKTPSQSLVERQAFRFADRILVNAEAIREMLVERGVPNAKITTIYNGLNLAKLRPATDSSRTERFERLGLKIPEEKRIVTIVANLRSEVKNHRMFLHAAAAAKQKFENAAFVIAGEGALTEAMQALAAQLGINKDVFFLGQCTDVPELLHASDICVLSSKSEGFSNSILEYMAAAKPVVATRVGGAPEVIVEGETGFLVESGDAAGMAHRLLELLRNAELAKAMGRRGRRVIEDRFTAPAQTAQVLKLYEDLCAKKTVSGSYT